MYSLEAHMCRTLTDRLLSVAIALSALATLPVHGQTVHPADQNGVAFDVVSVKSNTSASGASTIGFEPGGRFRAVNEPVTRLIQEAYATAVSPRPQIVGGPGWIEVDRFNVEAVTDRNPPPEQRQMMLRALLADRLKLAIRHETRELPIYNLVKSARDGKLGDNLRVSDLDCEALRKTGAPTPPPEQLRSCMLTFGRGSLRVKGMTTSQFATAGLARMVNRPVFDRTGLGATLYDWALEWTPDQPVQGAAATSQSELGLPSSIFSAVQEQLGLKLESAKGPVDILIIDHVEKPSAD
jgi:bla regulator protein blaR1